MKWKASCVPVSSEHKKSGKSHSILDKHRVPVSQHSHWRQISCVCMSHWTGLSRQKWYKHSLYRPTVLHADVDTNSVRNVRDRERAVGFATSCLWEGKWYQTWWSWALLIFITGNKDGQWPDVSFHLTHPFHSVCSLVLILFSPSDWLWCVKSIDVFHSSNYVPSLSIVTGSITLVDVVYAGSQMYFEHSHTSHLCSLFFPTYIK